MIQVLGNDIDGYIWQWLDAAANVLLYSVDKFTTDFAAFNAAMQYRQRFWSAAEKVDHHELPVMLTD